MENGWRKDEINEESNYNDDDVDSIDDNDDDDDEAEKNTMEI